ncbi:MAG: hypothetical protein L0211_25320 [Planctomycetaceae bacterium]|nr:hypothetical protein [Planctomycetaceae bacterium]
MAAKTNQPRTKKSRGKKTRSMNAPPPAPGKPGQPSAPGQEQDAKRRLGTFTTAGEHARVGSRTAGIVGQTKRAFQTDHKRTKSKAHFGKPDKSRGG